MTCSSVNGLWPNRQTAFTSKACFFQLKCSLLVFLVCLSEPVADGEEQFVRSTNPYATLRSPRTRTASASERLVNGDRSLQGSFTRLTESPTHDLSIISDSPTKEVSSLLSESPHGPTEFPHVTDSPSQDIASQISGLSQESQRTQESSRESPHHKIQYPTWDYSQCTYLAESCV